MKRISLRDNGQSISVNAPGVNPAAVERASESDREWFESHPGKYERLRPIVPGELPTECNTRFVIVTQIRPGFRLRRPAYLYGEN
jgi:hypothetical protein